MIFDERFQLNNNKVNKLTLNNFFDSITTNSIYVGSSKRKKCLKSCSDLFAFGEKRHSYGITGQTIFGLSPKNANKFLASVLWNTNKLYIFITSVTAVQVDNGRG